MPDYIANFIRQWILFIPQWTENYCSINKIHSPINMNTKTFMVRLVLESAI